MNTKRTDLLDRMTGIIAWLACDALVEASNYIDDAMGEWQQAVERDDRLADPYADAP